jgi:CDP-4-dehydro-6-deoxyglucose reductase, E3
MPVAVLRKGVKFSTTFEVDLLTCALDQGLMLPYSCRIGRCNACKVKLMSGTTKAIKVEEGLTELESSHGWILTCSRVALDDIELDAELIQGNEYIEPKTFVCRVKAYKRCLNNNVLLVELRLPIKNDLKFYAGQYLDLNIDGVYRSYSIAAFESNTIELHVAKVNGGLASEYFFNRIKENDLLRFRAPHGSFFLRNVEGKDIVFLATGTGIAPVNAMLQEIMATPSERRPKSVVVYWGGRNSIDLYFDLAACYDFVRFVPVLSGRGDGYVQSAFLREHKDLSNVNVYACGSMAMIKSAFELLSNEGLKSEQFHSDAFISSGSI